MIQCIIFWTVSPYDPDSHFTTSSISRLEEGAGINIMTLLADKCKQLMLEIGLTLEPQAKSKTSPKLNVNFIFKQWESGKSTQPPTWRSLLKILRKLNFNDMSQQIEDFLLGKCNVMLPCNNY